MKIYRNKSNYNFDIMQAKTGESEKLCQNLVLKIRNNHFLLLYRKEFKKWSYTELRKFSKPQNFIVSILNLKNCCHLLFSIFYHRGSDEILKAYYEI